MSRSPGACAGVGGGSGARLPDPPTQRAGRSHLRRLLASGLVVAWPWIGVVRGRPESAEVRRFDLRVVQESATPVSLLVDQGLGASVGERVRIEAWYSVGSARSALRADAVGFADAGLCAGLAPRGGGAPLPFYLVAPFVYIESATNPFLTNPIGMSMVLVSLQSSSSSRPRPEHRTGYGDLSVTRGRPSRDSPDQESTRT
jgi:hypothetical protein